jgi:Leucine-rich repeat (LRR) protein
MHICTYLRTDLQEWGQHGLNFLQVDNFLPGITPALPNLRHLQLVGLRLQEFLATLAYVLTSLTSLDLSDNSFRRLPAAISQMTALEELKLCGLPILVLHPSDVEIIAALPHLKGVSIDPVMSIMARSVSLKHAWAGPIHDLYPRNSLNFLKIVAAQLPHLYQ